MMPALQTIGRIPGVRSLPVISVALAAESTRQDTEELGLAHAAAKNAASLS